MWPTSHTLATSVRALCNGAHPPPTPNKMLNLESDQSLHFRLQPRGLNSNASKSNFTPPSHTQFGGVTSFPFVAVAKKREDKQHSGQEISLAYRGYPPWIQEKRGLLVLWIARACAHTHTYQTCSNEPSSVKGSKQSAI